MSCTLRASVRAMITSASSVRASTAAASLVCMWPVGMSAWSSKCPHRLGISWSSSWMAAAPARSSSRIVRMAASGPPYPVSASTTTGSRVASVSRPTWSATSPSEIRPRSGTPYCALASPAPVAYDRSEPGRLDEARAEGVGDAGQHQRARRRRGRRAARDDARARSASGRRRSGPPVREGVSGNMRRTVPPRPADGLGSRSAVRHAIGTAARSGRSITEDIDHDEEEQP